MPGRIWQDVLEDQHVGHHGRAGDIGHADHNQYKQFGTGQLVEIGLDDDQALDIADEDAGSHAERRSAAQTDRLFKDITKGADDDLEHADMPQQRRQG